MAKPPPLPPRRLPSESSLSSTDSPNLTSPHPRSDTIHLTPYSSRSGKQPAQPAEPAPPPAYSPYPGGFNDPRANSTQSLHPVESAGPDRRTLLLIYIHGFLGDETSFMSFPAHIHNLLSTTLAETHVVYSKIYPRYKSRKNITFARDDFSRWLAEREAPKTDVILVGHSLGGILAAEVVLIPGTGQYEYHHRILGIIAIDVPYLGMHPGVVSTGIASLFRPPPAEAAETQPPESSVASSATSPISPLSELSSNPMDPNFNPAYGNDVHLANRKGKLERAWYFWNKHWGELGKAAQSYVTSHLEFGGCLADYPGLRRRYDATRSLEDVDEYSHPRGSTGRQLRRVRFVNYYSASTGRIKEREVPEQTTQEMQNLSIKSAHASGATTPAARTPSPRISLEEHRDGQVIAKHLQELPEEQMAYLDPSPMADADTPLSDTLPDKLPESFPDTTPEDLQPSQSVSSDITRTTTSTTDNFPPLPPLPPLPTAPPDFDGTTYPDPDSLKIAQKDHDRTVKAYERAKKDREKSVREREKLVAKREKAALKEQQKHAKEQLKRSATLNPQEYDKQLHQEGAAKAVAGDGGGGVAAAPKKLKDRKFCSLPSKDPRTGKRDPTWVRVYMEGIDEVVAHTSMFKMSDTYATLVGDTVARIEDWVHEDATRRAVLEAGG